MNHNEDVAFNSIKLASTEESYSKNTGTLIVNGGIGCKKNIHTNGIISECLLNNKSAIFHNDVVICGKLKVNAIIPNSEDNQVCLGSPDIKFSNIYSNNIDTNNLYVNNNIISTNIKTNYLSVNNSASIGKNINCNTMLKVNDDNNTITTNSDLLTIKNNNEIVLEIDNKNVYINNILKLKYQILNISDHYDLHPSASIIIINNQCNHDINIKLCQHISSVSNELLDDGSYIRIYNKSSLNNIIVDNICIIVNSNVDFILHECEWIPLGHGYSDRNEHNENIYDFCQGQDHRPGNSQCQGKCQYQCQTPAKYKSKLYNSDSDQESSSNFDVESNSDYNNNCHNINLQSRKDIRKIPSVENLNKNYKMDMKKKNISNLDESSSFNI